MCLVRKGGNLILAVLSRCEQWNFRRHSPRRSSRGGSGSEMRPKGGDDGVLKIVAGVQLPIVLLHRKLVRASAITSETRSHDRPRVSTRKLRGIHVDPHGPSRPFHFPAS